MFRTKLFGLVLALLMSPGLLADTVALQPDHPDRYVVKKGDTLWDISSTFLQDPWRWPEIWHVNPQIENPHLIYPGDIIALVFGADGTPQLQLLRGRQTVKLSPKVRSTPLREAIPPIPMDAIAQFLDNSRAVLTQEELDSAPYIVESMDSHLIAGTGDHIYVRSVPDRSSTRFNVYRPGIAYQRPGSEEVLGYEALYVGDATLQRTGDPATLELSRTVRETLIGDRLLPVGEEEIQQNFFPQPPANNVDGQILKVIDGVSQIGQYQIVVIDLGTQDGMEQGTVLAVFQRGENVRDVVTKVPDQRVKLPDERSGLVMVFRPFEKVSYALVMSATRAIHINDAVRNP